MPNWCRNRLEVTGKEKTVKEFADIFSKEQISAFIPTPKELEDSEDEKVNIDKYGYKDWYDWRIANWGTKWNVDIDIEYFGENQYVVYFDSAWSPPIAAFEQISEKFPDLRFTLWYEESGVGFMGRTVFEGGLPDDLSIDYEPYSEFGWEIHKMFIDIESEFEYLLDNFSEEKELEKYLKCLTKYFEKNYQDRYDEGNIRLLFEALDYENFDSIEEICEE